MNRELKLFLCEYESAQHFWWLSFISNNWLQSKVADWNVRKINQKIARYEAIKKRMSKGFQSKAEEIVDCFASDAGDSRDRFVRICSEVGVDAHQ